MGIMGINGKNVKRDRSAHVLWDSFAGNADWAEWVSLFDLWLNPMGRWKKFALYVFMMESEAMYIYTYEYICTYIYDVLLLQSPTFLE